jgi:hypothetical protein
MKSNTVLTATHLTVSSPRFGEPVLRQNHLLTAIPLDIGTSIEAPRRRRKSAPERDRALLAIDALWPDGEPSLIILRNCTLCKEVAAWLKKRPMLEVKDDTILRAAKRRK